MQFVWFLVQTGFRPGWKLTLQKVISQKLAFRSIWQSVGLLLVLGWVWLSWATPAEAALLYTADTSGSVIVQSRRSLRDQNRYSWQVIAFKPIGADTREGPLALRLVGFPGAVELRREPARLTAPDQPELEARLADLSSQIPLNSPQPHVGQYDLGTALTQLPANLRLQLQVATRSRPVQLAVSPALLEEWQTVANTHYANVTQACDRFPVEARQNSAFPDWVGCR
ncbi:MAG: DUF3122 domain-containing protein [Elainella sp.]